VHGSAQISISHETAQQIKAPGDEAEKIASPIQVSIRLLARVVKEGVQFWYNDTSTVKRGGGGGGWVFEKNFLWKTSEVYITLLYVRNSVLSELQKCKTCPGRGPQTPLFFGNLVWTKVYLFIIITLW
jgi:hypothetical protein